MEEILIDQKQKTSVFERIYLIKNTVANTVYFHCIKANDIFDAYKEAKEKVFFSDEIIDVTGNITYLVENDLGGFFECKFCSCPYSFFVVAKGFNDVLCYLENKGWAVSFIKFLGVYKELK